MKKMTAGVVCVLFTVFFVSCGPGAADYGYDLVNGYELSRSSAHTVEVIPKDVWSSDDEIIPPKVVKIAWNDRYVIAKQLGMKRRDPKDPQDSYEIPDETKVYYWILDTEKKARYGPYTEGEFYKQLAKFQLTDLKLKAVEDYRTDK